MYRYTFSFYKNIDINMLSTNIYRYKLCLNHIAVYDFFTVISNEIYKLHDCCFYMVFLHNRYKMIIRYTF